MTDSVTDLRRRAGEIVAIVADRVSDPDTVQEAIDAEPAIVPDADDVLPRGLGLASGFPAVALLHAELGRGEPQRRTVAHAMLARATAVPHPPALTDSLFSGLPSLAFAARAAAVDPEDYQSLLGPLDTYVAEFAGRRATTAMSELRASPDATVRSFGSYDVISGLTGLGRYLLMTVPDNDESLADVLRFLVAVTRPGLAGDAEVPGWWVGHRPFVAIPERDNYPDGHANLGLAHGVPGPLALLALTWSAGLRVPGQREAMECIVDWVLRWRRPDRHGVCWPDVISLDEHLGKSEPASPCVATWCYGLPGIARAVQLAGLALDRPGWRQVADDAMASLLSRPEPQWHLFSAAVCHGWAGLLQIALRIAADSATDDDAATARRVADVAARHTIALFDSDLPFGYRYPASRPFEPFDGVGLLEGASGTALALHSYATGRLPESRWDAALLLT